MTAAAAAAAENLSWRWEAWVSRRRRLIDRSIDRVPCVSAHAGIGAAAFVLAKVGVVGGGSASLEDLAVPLDTALTSARPLVVEFYADW